MAANQGWAIFFVSGSSLSLSLSPPEKCLYRKISLFKFVCCSGLTWDLISFGNEGCITRCQYNCRHCKQVSGLSLVYLHLHHFLHGLQNSCMVFGVILHHVWSLCNHFEANDIVGVLAAFPVCFLIFSSPDLRNDMPHLLFEEVNIYILLSLIHSKCFIGFFFPSWTIQYNTPALVFCYLEFWRYLWHPKYFFFNIQFPNRCNSSPAVS